MAAEVTASTNGYRIRRPHAIQEPATDIAIRNEVDESEPFKQLCEACRRGDVKAVHYLIVSEGVNINGVDRFDYTPLTLAGLCGHFEVVRLLLESGASCVRDTFQGERVLYNALNDKIKKLLLEYDYSKSVNPTQPWASHITSLLKREPLDTTDVAVTIASPDSSSLLPKEFRLHKFILSARSPYFRRKLAAAQYPKPIKAIRLPEWVHPRAFEYTVRFLYLSDTQELLPEEVLENIGKLSQYLEIPDLWDLALAAVDPRQRRTRHRESVEGAQAAIASWFHQSVLARKLVVPLSETADAVKVYPHNDTFADVLLGADDPDEEEAHVYPVHKAMLRSDFFSTMFTSHFREGQRQSPDSPLQTISLPETRPEVLHLLLSFFYLEAFTIPLEHALDLLLTADQLLVEPLKPKCALVIAAAGNTDMRDLPYSIYDVVRAGWITRQRRLEEFGARYIAERLEAFIQDPEFAELVAESAERIAERHETDTIELVDDIRYYLDERFRMRVDDNMTLPDDLPDDDQTTDDAEPDAAAAADRDLATGKAYLYHDLLSRVDQLLDGLRLDA